MSEVEINKPILYCSNIRHIASNSFYNKLHNSGKIVSYKPYFIQPFTQNTVKSLFGDSEFAKECLIELKLENRKYFRRLGKRLYK